MALSLIEQTFYSNTRNAGYIEMVVTNHHLHARLFDRDDKFVRDVELRFDGKETER